MQKLFDEKNVGCAEMLGDAAENGLGLPKDDEKAIAYFMKAEEWGSDVAAGRIAGILQKKSDPEAFLWAKKGAENGDHLAMIWLQRFYRDGMGTEKNPTEHLKILGKLIELGEPIGFSDLADDYFWGIILPKNFALALKYYKQAEEMGWDSAGRIAYCLTQAAVQKDDSVDSSEAFKWAKLAVERNEKDFRAHCALGACYLFGLGVPADRQKAMKHSQIAIELGDETSKNFLDRGFGDADGNGGNAD